MLEEIFGGHLLPTLLKDGWTATFSQVIQGLVQIGTPQPLWENFQGLVRTPFTRLKKLSSLSLSFHTISSSSWPSIERPVLHWSHSCASISLILKGSIQAGFHQLRWPSVQPTSPYSAKKEAMGLSKAKLRYIWHAPLVHLVTGIIQVDQVWFAIGKYELAFPSHLHMLDVSSWNTSPQSSQGLS